MSSEIFNQSNLHLSAPIVTKQRFSDLTGLSEEIIRGMINRGYLPTVKLGKHRMINIALITRDALELEHEA